MRRALQTVAFYLVVTSAPALAQTPQPPPPQQTTASFQDWTVRCVQAEGQPQRQCEMVQSASVKGQANPISEIAIGRPDKAAPIKIVIQLPIGVSLPNGAKLTFDPKTQALTAAFKRCLPAVCFADTELKDDVVKRLRSTVEQGQLQFEDGNRQPITLPVSFKGFSQAFDAMAKE